MIAIIILHCASHSSVLAASKITLEHADFSELRADPTGSVYIFRGHVHFTRGESNLHSDEAIWYEGEKRISLFGKVKIEEPTRWLTADTVYYDQISFRLRASGNVVILDQKRQVQLTGGKADYNEKEDVLVMHENPRLVSDIDRPAMQTVVLADTIKYYSQENMVEAVDSVMMTQGSLVARGTKGVSYLDREETCLTGGVRASQRNNTLSGEEMTVYSEEKVLQKIEVRGRGETLYRQPARADTVVYNENRLTAENIDFFFGEDRLQVIKASGNSYSYYTPAREDTVSKGSNVASGDSTILLFENGELNQVYVITSAEGTYMAPASYDSLGNPTTIDTVSYQASRLHYLLRDDLIHMTTAARVKQGTIVLDAHEITYDVGKRTLQAVGHQDSDSSKYQPLLLRDGAEVIEGEQLAYNLVDKRGKIKKSKTELERAFYRGGILRKEEEDVLLARDASYTGCDVVPPHFHFQMSNMKLKTDDKVFARPVVLYIETLPVLALPYFVFSIKKGRHSGFLPLQFGNFEQGQRFVNNIGYYWALSEYWDLRTSIDVHETAGLKFNAAARYALRYKLSGNVSGSYARETDYIDYLRFASKRWQLAFSHDQTIDPSLRITGYGNFVSDARYARDFSTDLSERLNRQLRSQLNMTKRWEWGTMTLAVDQTKNIDTDEHTEALPRASFSKQSAPLFRAPKEAKDRRWYHEFVYAYGSSFSNSRSKTKLNDSTFSRRKTAVVEQNSSLRSPQKVFGSLNITPSFSIRDFWYYLPYSDQAVLAGLETNSFKNRQTWSTSLALSTNLYGTVAPNVAGITGLRHVITPSASFNYVPKFTRNLEYARFTGAGSSGGKSKNVSFSLGNQFQMKYRRGEKEPKIPLLNVNLSASYDFVRDERRWSNLATSMSTPTYKNVSLSVRMVHDLYNEVTGDLQWWNPRLRTVSISSDYSASLRIPVGGVEKQTPSLAAAIASGSSPFRFQFSHRYSESRGASFTSISHWVNFSFDFALSKDWRVRYHQNYNLRERESTEKVVDLYRDLHCWEGTFTWIPAGSRKGYYFKLSAKLIPDLKFEKSESGIRDALFSGFLRQIQQ